MEREPSAIKSTLRVLLAENKMNMSKLSEIANVSRATISGLQDEIPLSTKLATLMRLAQALDIDWLDLIGSE